MMEFLAANFNLPTIIVGAIVFGGVGRYAAKYRNLRSLYAHDSTDAHNWQENLISFELA